MHFRLGRQRGFPSACLGRLPENPDPLPAAPPELTFPDGLQKEERIRRKIPKRAAVFPCTFSKKVVYFRFNSEGSS